MSNLNERLDQLRSLLQNRDFLDGKGLSNEVNIRIFCYDPAEEMKVQHFIRQITTDQSSESHVVEYNLYHLFMDICHDLDILDSIAEMEECDGSDYVLEQLHAAIGEDEFICKMKESGELRPGNVMLITGVGDVFPFMRVHKMLEAVQPHFDAIPILVMYPGIFDGNSLRLFEKLKPNAYYRAFNVI